MLQGSDSAFLSTNTNIAVERKGEVIICNFNLKAGSVFEGFASYNHGPINFEDLNSKLKTADFSTVDEMVSDHIAGDSSSDYDLLKSDARMLPFGKLIGNPGKLEISS